MRRFFKWTLALAVSVLLLIALLLVHTWYFKPLTADMFYTRVFAAYALKSPQMLSELRVLPPMLDFHSDDLDDVSPEAERELIEGGKKDLARLKSYDRGAMTGEARLSYDTLVHFMEAKVEGDRFRDHAFPVNQLSGMQMALPEFMVKVHEVDNVTDAHNYIERLSKFPVQFEQTIRKLKISEAKGILPPRFTIDHVVTQMTGFITPAPKQNTLYLTFAEKLGKVSPDEIGAAKKAELLAAAAKAIEDSVYPAYHSMIGHFTGLQVRTKASNGAWSLADGDAYYAYLVRLHTTTAMTPQQVHDIGLAQVARVGSEMDALLREQGLRDGTIGARVRTLSGKPEQLWPNTEEGKKAMLARYQEILNEIDKGAGAAFDKRPKMGVEVKAVPEYAQATAPFAYYTSGSGSRPGIMNVNLRNPGETPKFSMRSLTYHEGMPGHHFQVASAREIEDVPFFRTVIGFTAYTEGWALYSERLASELGFGNEPLDALGRLTYEMLRAARLVVDTGIHHKRWTREQAIAYMVDHTGMNEEKAASEVERYFVDPGQALGYEIGKLKILELRSRAQQVLGARFDLKQFHNEVLGHGELPLTVLENVIDDWIARNKGVVVAQKSGK